MVSVFPLHYALVGLSPPEYGQCRGMFLQSDNEALIMKSMGDADIWRMFYKSNNCCYYLTAFVQMSTQNRYLCMSSSDLLRKLPLVLSTVPLSLDFQPARNIL